MERKGWNGRQSIERVTRNSVGIIAHDLVCQDCLSHVNYQIVSSLSSSSFPLSHYPSSIIIINGDHQQLARIHCIADLSLFS
ncbi:hypothetical protein VN97_g10598 [Penicillium thymicola]|uniref:Uncharacterized protein n=1 Tax=Penicillium thymicola TaxID=293382 RepID=A0AAI9T8N8_PENTH|nr:hypothetical protein VN97_g10598 [Penicillium thymicola]